MLVSALMGLEVMKRAYAHAVEQKYRFYSYGDASLLLPWTAGQATAASPTITSTRSSTMAATNWQVEGIGDFNGDGRDDILWRNDTGLDDSTGWARRTGGFADN